MHQAISLKSPDTFRKSLIHLNSMLFIYSTTRLAMFRKFALFPAILVIGNLTAPLAPCSLPTIEPLANLRR